MKVLHVITVFYPATYWGGPIYSTLGLCRALAAISRVQLRVLTTDSAGPRLEDRVSVDSFPMHYEPGYEVFFCRRTFGNDFSPSMLVHLVRLIRWADVVHITGVYSPTTIPGLLLCMAIGRPVVWSPRGALQRWPGTRRIVLKGLWEAICNVIIRNINCVLHSTSAAEETESRARIPAARSIVIPNGVEIPGELSNRTWRAEGRLRLLYLGRLDEKKGIENLLRALALLPANAFSLTVCGTGGAEYVNTLVELCGTIGVQDRVIFAGQVESEEKSKALTSSDVCVVPSHTENFGMVVAEALAYGTPVIASTGTPWREMEEVGCGFWVNNDPASLAEALRRMREADLGEMGRRGHVWMAAKYSWNNVARKVLDVYEESCRLSNKRF